MFYSSDGIRTVMPSYQGAAWMMDGDIFTPTMTPTPIANTQPSSSQCWDGARADGARVL